MQILVHCLARGARDWISSTCLSDSTNNALRKRECQRDSTTGEKQHTARAASIRALSVMKRSASESLSSSIRRCRKPLPLNCRRRPVGGRACIRLWRPATFSSVRKRWLTTAFVPLPLSGQAHHACASVHSLAPTARFVQYERAEILLLIIQGMNDTPRLWRFVVRGFVAHWLFGGIRVASQVTVSSDTLVHHSP
jgi:hypothetical protein